MIHRDVLKTNLRPSITEYGTTFSQLWRFMPVLLPQDR